MQTDMYIIQIGKYYFEREEIPSGKVCLTSNISGAAEFSSLVDCVSSNKLIFDSIGTIVKKTEITQYEEVNIKETMKVFIDGKINNN